MTDIEAISYQCTLAATFALLCVAASQLQRSGCQPRQARNEKISLRSTIPP